MLISEGKGEFRKENEREKEREEKREIISKK